MRVFVETNFVLELAFEQEQAASCLEIVRLSEEGRLQLLIPAYSLVEPYETVRRRHQQRRNIERDLQGEWTQLNRTAIYAEQFSGFQGVTSLLIESIQDEVRRLEEIRSRLLDTCDVIPLDPAVLTSGSRYQRQHGLSPQDAVVYTSIIEFLAANEPQPSCFLNRNWKDFEDPDIIDELRSRGCVFIASFDHGLAHLSKALDL